MVVTSLAHRYEDVYTGWILGSTLPGLRVRIAASQAPTARNLLRLQCDRPAACPEVARLVCQTSPAMARLRAMLWPRISQTPVVCQLRWAWPVLCVPQARRGPCRQTWVPRRGGGPVMGPGMTVPGVSAAKWTGTPSADLGPQAVHGPGPGLGARSPARPDGLMHHSRQRRAQVLWVPACQAAARLATE